MFFQKCAGVVTTKSDPHGILTEGGGGVKFLRRKMTSCKYSTGITFCRYTGVKRRSPYPYVFKKKNEKYFHRCNVWSFDIRPGVYVIGPGQSGIYYQHHEMEFGDHANLTDIIEAAKMIAKDSKKQ